MQLVVLTRWRVVLASIATLLLLSANQSAFCETPDTSSKRATQLKAAFLYKFGKFVEWPLRADRPDHPRQICILDPNPFGDALDRIALINDPSANEVIIRRLKNVALASTCHFLYLPQGTDLKAALPAIRQWSIVTVSDIHNFLKEGGIIELYEDRVNISFKINQIQAQQAGIRISSKLLFLAKEVIKE